MFRFCIIFMICLIITGVCINDLKQNEDKRCIENRVESVGGNVRDIQVKTTDGTTIYTARYTDQNGDIKFAKYIKESSTDKYFIFID